MIAAAIIQSPDGDDQISYSREPEDVAAYAVDTACFIELEMRKRDMAYWARAAKEIAATVRRARDRK